MEVRIESVYHGAITVLKPEVFEDESGSFWKHFGKTNLRISDCLLALFKKSLRVVQRRGQRAAFSVGPANG